MFLKQLIKNNKKFVDVVLDFHKKGYILPDTYCIDLDTFLENSIKIYESAKKNNITLYYMLKQVGRNPYLAKKLEEVGYSGAVCVDFKDVEIMMKKWFENRKCRSSGSNSPLYVRKTYRLRS